MNKTHILLVEDSPNDVKLILHLLREYNVTTEVVVVHDGAEALDYLFGTGRHNGRGEGLMPALVLLDLKLPKINGFEVLQRLRAEERTKSLPVIVLTSSDSEDDILSSYKLGATSYVRKPIEFTQLSDGVQQLGLYGILFQQTRKQGPKAEQL